MKPSCSAPNVGAPDACSRARDRPKLTAFSAVGRPGSTQARIRHSASSASTSATRDGAGLGQPGQPRGLALEEPVGGCGRVLTSADPPSRSRTRVAVQMSPPATGVGRDHGVPSSCSTRSAIVGMRATTVSLSKPPGASPVAALPTTAPTTGASASEERQQGLAGGRRRRSLRGCREPRRAVGIGDQVGGHVEQRVGQRARDRVVETAGLGDVPPVHRDLQGAAPASTPRRAVRRRRRSGRGRAGRSRRREPSRRAAGGSRPAGAPRAGWRVAGGRPCPRSAASVKAASQSSMCSSRVRRSQRAQGVGASSSSARTPVQRDPRVVDGPLQQGHRLHRGGGGRRHGQLAAAYDAGSVPAARRSRRGRRRRRRPRG